MKRGDIRAGNLIALVFTMAVLGACSSGPKPYTAIEPIMPDEQSAVVYFIGGKNYGIIWDGDQPIGSYNDKKMPLVPNIAYKTTPGEHYFFANASNWPVMRADLEPNKRYVVRIMALPSPPFTTLITMFPLAGNDREEWLKHKSVKTIAFSDKWRAEFAQGNRLTVVQGKLQEAKKDDMDVTMSGEHGL